MWKVSVVYSSSNCVLNNYITLETMKVVRNRQQLWYKRKNLPSNCSCRWTETNIKPGLKKALRFSPLLSLITGGKKKSPAFSLGDPVWSAVHLYKDFSFKEIHENHSTLMNKWSFLTIEKQSLAWGCGIQYNPLVFFFLFIIAVQFHEIFRCKILRSEKPRTVDGFSLLKSQAEKDPDMGWEYFEI